MRKHEIRVEDIVTGNGEHIVERELVSAHGQSNDKKLVIATDIVTKEVTFRIYEAIRLHKIVHTINEAVEEYNKL